jgi:hypothetical protein
VRKHQHLRSTFTHNPTTGRHDSGVHAHTSKSLERACPTMMQSLVRSDTSFWTWAKGAAFSKCFGRIPLYFVRKSAKYPASKRENVQGEEENRRTSDALLWFHVAMVHQVTVKVDDADFRECRTIFGTYTHLFTRQER